MSGRHLCLVSCEVFYREMCKVVADTANIVSIQFLPQGLHDLESKEMTARIQDCLNGLNTERAEAILLGFGLCNNGLAGIESGDLPLVIPRAHDCITLFMGSRQRYREYFDANPGTYFLTSGWIERDYTGNDLHGLSIQHQTGMDRSYEQLVEKYGQDNADFLWEQLSTSTTHNYGRFTFIEMGVEPDGSAKLAARERAERRQWEFHQEKGDLSIFRKLVDGEWNEEDFLVVPPHHRLVATYDDASIVRAEPLA